MEPLARPRQQSLESPGPGSDRRRDAASAAHRSTPASTRSSTSSDILVASGPPPPLTILPLPAANDLLLPASLAMPMAGDDVRAEVRGGHLLVVKSKGEKARNVWRRMRDDDERRNSNAHAKSESGVSVAIKDEADDDDLDGPNARGTYSKQYILQHPETEWVHRGQGRYLPALHSRFTNSHRSSSLSKASSDYGLRKTVDDWKNKPRSPTLPQRRRSLDDDNKTSIFATPRPRLSLRRQYSEAQTVPTTDPRSSRLSRRAKAVPTTEFERRSSRILTQQNYNEDDEDDSMADDKEATFDKAYVDAHPGEKFYHTGNGWYKRGDRPKGRRLAKHRDEEGHALLRRRDGSWQFDNNKTIHVSQLDNYPGVEFHHCGNGWYKPGPDVSGHRSSLIVGDEEDEEGAVLVAEDEEEEDDDDDEEDDQDEAEDQDEDDTAVSKEYALAHPEVKWVHRGNGRYKRKSAVSAPTTQASTSISPEEDRDQTIYTKEYVLAHPDEEFHHRGNARYMRGPPPDHWASSRRKKSLAAESVAEEDDAQLFSKSYVRAHPNEVFHHRGQGRYARGLRVKPSMVPDEEDEESDGAQDGLVDTDYVNAHPEDTFHHRGQGRWARGFPPAGASNKTAIRGPGYRDRSDAANLLEEEDEANKPPPLTALVLRAEGPDKWPGLSWNYRGGGKWGRMTKQEFEEMQKANQRKAKGKGRARNTDGPEAQLEREAAAAEAVRCAGDDDGYYVPGDMDVAGLEKPKIKRRRINKMGSFHTLDDSMLSKQSSNPQSQAPTPKPRMLEPEEDILTEEDLPQLYRDDDWSPDPEDLEDYGQHRLDNLFRPITAPDKFVTALTKHDPAARSLDNLKRLAENTQRALDSLQDEYLFLDKVTAPHARIPRKPVKGGRLPVDAQVFEDKKEADLYDYAYDPRRLGFQDPAMQQIQRDADGRELRNRRNRSGAQTHSGTLPGWNFGEDEPLGPRRAVKPVNRFDGIVDQPRSRRGGRLSANGTVRGSKAPSMTPDRATTPLGGPVLINGYAPATSGRWRGHVPKRIRELRGDSVGLSGPGAGGAGARAGAGTGVGGGVGNREASPASSFSARKGRPPGSKNLHRRRDAGIKKGPRRPRGNGEREREISVGSEGDEY